MIHARRSPSGHRWRSATSPVRGGFRRGQSPSEGLCPVTAARHLAPLSFLYKERTKEILMSYPKK